MCITSYVTWTIQNEFFFAVADKCPDVMLNFLFYPTRMWTEKPENARILIVYITIFTWSTDASVCPGLRNFTCSHSMIITRICISECKCNMSQMSPNFREPHGRPTRLYEYLAEKSYRRG